jgi:acetyl esterase/lipase
MLMNAASTAAGENVANGSRRNWGQRLLTLLAALVTLFVVTIVLGALFPLTGLIAVIGTAAESLFTLHVFLAGLVGVALSWSALRLGGRRATAIILALAIFATVGAAIPLIALVRMAHRYGAPISWTEHLHVAAPGPRATPDQTELFATVDGKSLYLDVYFSKGAGHGPLAASTVLFTPVVMIHGGGFSLGERSMGRNWDRWFAARGYTVFDVDYRLDPPVTWNLAAPDVACAMAWVAAHADEYHVAPDRMLITGQSAGGGLALQVAYGLGDGTVTSSCGGTVPEPKAVLALYPPEDFALARNLDTRLGPISSRALHNDYLGGSPEQFPERYRVVSPVFHVRPGLPPTLIAAGLHDHLVPFGGHDEIVAKLNAAGVPYGEHGYDLAWGSTGGQITRKVVADFLARYLAATEGQH